MLFPGLNTQWVPAGAGPAEAWTWLQFFEVPEHAARLIDRRMRHNFGGLEPWRKERQWNAVRRAGTVPTLHDGRQKTNYANRISAALRQAREVWHAGMASPPFSKPILLMYGAEHLAQALILATYKTGIARSHGLDWTRNDAGSDSVTIRERGLFQQLHDAHTQSAQLYLGTPTFELEELFSVDIDILDEFYMTLGREPLAKPFDGMSWDHELSSGLRTPVVHDGWVYRLHPIEYRFLSLFILGSKARYQPWEWARYLESGRGFLAQTFLHRVETRLPLLFLSELLGQEFNFGMPASPVNGWTFIDI